MNGQPSAVSGNSGSTTKTSFSRKDCPTCGPETLHRSNQCVHCGRGGIPMGIVRGEWMRRVK